jgi:hypothetical protein
MLQRKLKSDEESEDAVKAFLGFDRGFLIER